MLKRSSAGINGNGHWPNFCDGFHQFLFASSFYVNESAYGRTNSIPCELTILILNKINKQQVKLSNRSKVLLRLQNQPLPRMGMILLCRFLRYPRRTEKPSSSILHRNHDFRTSSSSQQDSAHLKTQVFQFF